MPSLRDSNFSKSVVYLYEHTDKGAMGLMINKPLEITLGNVLRHLKIKIRDESIGTYPVFLGGPVNQEQGFVLYQNSSTSKKTNTKIIISASKEFLETIAIGKGPKDFMIALGYAGWSAGQLEKELNANDWLIVPANSSVLFTTPVEKRWEAAAKLMGVDINQLSDQVGHA